MLGQPARQKSEPLSIEALQNEWANHPLGKNRVWGGRRALDGFLFQLYLSLDQFFTEVLDQNRDAQFLFDGLSDIAHFQGEIVYLTQVKATLRPESLRSCFDEALALERFLQELHPALLPKIRYQLVVRRATTSELPIIADLEAQDLKLKDEDARLWPAVRGRFLPVKIQANPRVDLAIRLWPEAKQCFTLVDICLGRLFDLVGQNRPSGEIAQSLLDIWDRQRTQARPPGKLLSARDLYPSETKSNRIVHGVLPGPQDLSEGCFMPRPAVLEMALAKVRESAAKLQALEKTQPVPVFWISGPSGSGKSVLLLQLMYELAANSHVEVINYLGQLAHTLPRALSSWTGTSEQVLIAVDDLYAPENRDARLWKEIAELLFDANWGHVPWLLTCGPTEQLRAFDQIASGYPQLRTIEIKIQSLNPEERAAYHDWYQNRTGAKVAFTTEQIFVAAAWIYELRRQEDLSPDAFAWKFYRRLAELGIQPQAQVAIALNQYGLKAPDALFAGCEAGLDKLTQEQIYRLAQPKEGVRKGRFFHQQIARIIYDVIVPETEIRPRAEDLAAGFAAMLAVPEEADAFMGWLNLPKTQSRMMNPRLRNETISAMWGAFSEAGPQEDLVPRLKRWHDMAHTEQINLMALGVSGQIGRWFEETSEDAPPWGLLFQMVWNDADQEHCDRLYARAEGWLQTHFEAGAWNWIWQQLWEHRPKDPGLTDLAYLWLYDHPQHHGWSRVWIPIFESGVRAPELLKIALQALPLTPESPADIPIWRMIETLHPDQAPFLDGIVQKLAHTKNPYVMGKGADFLLARMKEASSCAQILVSISAVASAPEWPYLWQALIAKGLHNREILLAGRDWLRGHEEKPSWAFVWRQLVELGFERKRLLPIGRAWLQGHEEKPEWSHVWRRLVELGFERERLLPMGRDWLHGHEEKPEWAFVWEWLAELGFESEHLLAMGRDWLQGHEEKPEWNYVWQRLVELGFERERLLPMGRDWLQGRHTRPEYPHVYRVLYGTWPPRGSRN